LGTTQLHFPQALWRELASGWALSSSAASWRTDGAAIPPGGTGAATLLSCTWRRSWSCRQTGLTARPSSAWLLQALRHHAGPRRCAAGGGLGSRRCVAGGGLGSRRCAAGGGLSSRRCAAGGGFRSRCGCRGGSHARDRCGRRRGRRLGRCLQVGCVDAPLAAAPAGRHRGGWRVARSP
jgi:hypothetical protein